MNKFVIILTVSVALLFMGCAMSSGVKPVGKNTYMVSVHAAPARGGYSGARGLALEEANQYCAQMGKHIQVYDMDTRESGQYFGGGYTGGSGSFNRFGGGYTGGSGIFGGGSTGGTVGVVFSCLDNSE